MAESNPAKSHAARIRLRPVPPASDALRESPSTPSPRGEPDQQATERNGKPPAAAVEHPKPDFTVCEPHCSVRGRCHGLARVAVRVGQHRRQQSLMGQDRFHLSELPVEPGINHVELTFYPEAESVPPWSEILPVTRVAPFLAGGQSLDPLTRKPLQADDAVFRCLACRRYQLARSWADRRKCCLCGHRHKIGPDDPRFFAPSDQTLRYERSARDAVQPAIRLTRLGQVSRGGIRIRRRVRPS